MPNQQEAIQQMLTLSPLLAELCQPLFKISPITFYSYYEFDSNAQVYYLVSHREFYESYIDTFVSPSKNDGDWAINMPAFIKDHQRMGFCLRDLEPGTSGSRFSLLHSFGLGHAFCFIEQMRDGRVRVHYFLGQLNDDRVNDFCLNNTNLLTYFARYLASKTAPTITNVKPIELSGESKDVCRRWVSKIQPSSRESIPRFLASYAPHIKLSTRQKEIIHWYLMGKTTEETAVIIGVSKNTINTYFERMKDKFGCRSKAQILAEVFRHGVCFSDLSPADTFNGRARRMKRLNPIGPK